MTARRKQVMAWSGKADNGVATSLCVLREGTPSFARKNPAQRGRRGTPSEVRALSFVVPLFARLRSGRALCDQVVNHFTIDVGQSEVASCVPIGESLMVDAHQV